MGTLCVDQRTFFIISPSVLRRMRNVADKSCTENRNTNFMFGDRGSTVVKVLSYKSEGRWFHRRRGHKIFH
jgi:hypothetical protein